MKLKLVKRVIPTAIAAGCLWAVAPALSLAPYHPDPFDFEQPLGNLHRITEGHGLPGGEQVGFISAEVAAPDRFDLVGVAGEVRAYDVRTRSGGSSWSNWVTTGDGSPVYAGGADFVQVRSEGFRLVGQLHYVNVSGSDSLGDQLLNGVRDSVNSAVIGTISAFNTPAFGGSDVDQPEIIRRSEWGAEDCPTQEKPAYGEVKAIAIHHTVSTNDYSESEAASVVLGICRYHVYGQHWNDIGYQFLVDRFGNVYEGRDGGKRKAVVGAQSEGFNSQTAGVALIGDHSNIPMSDAAGRSLRKLLAWKLTLHGIGNAEGSTTLTSAGGPSNRYSAGTKVKIRRIFPHIDGNTTACPGEGVIEAMPRLRRGVQRLIDEYYPDGYSVESGGGGTDRASSVALARN